MCWKERDIVLSRPTSLGSWASNWRIIKTAELLPKNQVFWVLHWAPSTGICTIKMNPQSIKLWRQMRLAYGRTGGLQERVTLFLKGACQVSHTPCASRATIISKEPMWDPPANVRVPPEEAGGNWDSLCGHWCNGTHLGELIISW